MAVGDVYRAEVHQNIGSEPSMNVLHIIETVSETANPIPAQAVVEMVGELYTGLVDYLSEDWRVVQITARKVVPAGGIPATLIFGGAESIVGTVESEVVPSQTAALVSLYTAVTDRTGRGRIYIPGFPESSQNEGQMTETPYTAMQADLVTLLIGEKGPFAGGDGKFKFCVCNPSAAVTVGHPLVAVTLRPNLATQRRRRAFPGFGAV